MSELDKILREKPDTSETIASLVTVSIIVGSLVFFNYMYNKMYKNEVEKYKVERELDSLKNLKKDTSKVYMYEQNNR